MAHMLHSASRLTSFSTHTHRNARSHPVSFALLRRANQTAAQPGNIPINSSAPIPPAPSPRKPLIVIPAHLKSAPSTPGGVKLIPTRLITEVVTPQPEHHAAPPRQIPRDIKLPEIKWASQGASENRRLAQNEAKQKRALERTEERKLNPVSVTIPEVVNPKGLSNLLGVRVVDILKMMIKLGEDPTNSDDVISPDLAELIAQDLHFVPQRQSSEPLVKARAKVTKEQAALRNLETRSPVVCILGHVDHGKTTLLDALRHTSVAAGEAGGITQHIGAFIVDMPSGEKITFLDTPGHAAFEGIRARGARVTDVAVLVIAADDGIRETTIEAIKLIKKSGTPMVVALNKCDRSEANPRKIIDDLLQYDVQVEKYGGDVQCIEISARTRLGLDSLAEAVLIQAQVMDLRADRSGMAEAVVLESRMDKQLGPVASVLVRCGQLREGDYFVAGTAYGRVRSLLDPQGGALKDAGPSMPVQLLGSRSLPEVGEDLLVVDSERVAKYVAQQRAQTARQASAGEQISKQQEETEKLKKHEAMRLVALAEGVTLDDLKTDEEKAAEEQSRLREFNAMIKSDVLSSLEAINKLAAGLPQDEVQLRWVRSGFGSVSEADVELAKLTGAQIYAFNITVSNRIKAYADENGVRLMHFDVVYQMMDDISEQMSKLLPSRQVVTPQGTAEVQQLFTITGPNKEKLTIAGSKVLDGSISRKEKVQLLRNGEVIFDGRIDTLRSFKKDVNEVKSGAECGIGLRGFEGEIKPGDTIRCYTTSRVERKLGEKL